MKGRDVEPRKIQILRLRGEITLEDCIKIRNLINEYMVGGQVHVVLNLGQVNHIHLAGLPVLVERAKRLRQYGGDLRLTEVGAYLHHILELAGVKPLFKIYDNETQAAESFK